MIVLKGKGHPDEVATTLSEVAIHALHEFNPELYGNFDKSYIKASRFPEFVVGGELSFDFNKYEIDYRHKMESFISDKVKSTFREIFPKCAMNVKFNLNLFPNTKQNYFRDYHDSSSVMVSISEISRIEKDVLDFADIVSEYPNSGTDFDISVTDNKVILNITFVGDENVNYDDEYNGFVKYLGDVGDVMGGRTLVINPISKNINRFGSRLFVNKSGHCGDGNEPIGLRNYSRPRVDSFYGTHPHSSVRKLYEEGKDLDIHYCVEGESKELMHTI